MSLNCTFTALLNNTNVVIQYITIPLNDTKMSIDFTEWQGLYYTNNVFLFLKTKL